MSFVHSLNEVLPSGDNKALVHSAPGEIEEVQIFLSATRERPTTHISEIPADAAAAASPSWIPVTHRTESVST